MAKKLKEYRNYRQAYLGLTLINIQYLFFRLHVKWFWLLCSNFEALKLSASKMNLSSIGFPYYLSYLIFLFFFVKSLITETIFV